MPGPVGLLLVNTTGTTTAIVSWTPPDEFGQLVESFVIQYSTSCKGHVMNDSLSMDSQALSVQLTDLEEGQNYTISVTATSADGNGEPVTVSYLTPSIGCLK